nr:hypothetical protein [Tanacetum cinerariifolium]
MSRAKWEQVMDFAPMSASLVVGLMVSVCIFQVKKAIMVTLVALRVRLVPVIHVVLREQKCIWYNHNKHALEDALRIIMIVYSSLIGVDEEQPVSPEQPVSLGGKEQSVSLEGKDQQVFLEGKEQPIFPHEGKEQQVSSGPKEML